MGEEHFCTITIQERATRIKYKANDPMDIHIRFLMF